MHCASAFVWAKRSIGAPVRDSSGAAVAAINVSDANSLIKDPDGAVKDAVLATAAAISARLGHRSAAGQVRRAQPDPTEVKGKRRSTQSSQITFDA